MRTICLAIVLLGAVSATLATPYYAPDEELMHPGLAPLSWSSPGATLHARVDVPGPGVAFAVSVPAGGKLAIADEWPIEPAAGLAPDPGVPGGCQPHDNSSLADFDRYEMLVSYLAGPPGSDIDVLLFLNTGLIGGSGYPSWDGQNDTYWECPAWATLSVGETIAVVLEFDAAKAWNISDNPVPHTGGGLGWPEGGIYAINDRDLHEISAIGLQIADWDGDTLGAPIAVGFNIPEPAVLSLVGAGLLGLRVSRRKRRK